MLTEYGIELTITEACNACCSYCYQGKQHRNIHMKLGTAINIINKVKNDPKFNGYINFFGGEPTLRYNIITKIMDTYPNFKYSIVSNGRFIFDSKWDKYIKRLDGISISIEVNNDESWNQRRIKDLKYLIDKVCSYNINTRFTIVVGDHLIGKENDLLNISQYMLNKNVNLHYFTNLKPDSIYDNEKFIDFLYWFKDKDITIYKKLINYTTNTLRYFTYKSDQICDLEENIHFNTDGSTVPCGQYINNYKSNKIYYHDLNNMLEYAKYNIIKYAMNNIKNDKFNCNDCIITNKTHCNICHAVIDNIVDNDILFSMCERNKLLHMMRIELIELGELPV